MRSKWPPETPPTLLYPLHPNPRNHHVLTPPPADPHPRALSTSLSRMPPKLFNFRTQPLTANQAIPLLLTLFVFPPSPPRPLHAVHPSPPTLVVTPYLSRYAPSRSERFTLFLTLFSPEGPRAMPLEKITSTLKQKEREREGLEGERTACRS